MKPDLQFSILCDDVRREDNGKFIFIGLFDVIGTKNFPTQHGVMFVANRWCKGEGEFKQKSRIIDSVDKKLIVESPEVTFRLEDISQSHTVISKFSNITFPRAGKYWVEVLLDGQLTLDYPLMLVEDKRP